MRGWSAPIVTNANSQHVIPAKAGTRRRASARQRLIRAIGVVQLDSRFRGNDVGFFRVIGGLILLTAMTISATARAQETAAQSLYDVKEIVVRPVRFDDPETAKSCRLAGEDLDAAILKELQDNGLPAIAESNARPTVIDSARIMLVPQIIPYNSQGMDCVTWVSLSAETRNHLRVLPVEIPRVVNVVYWRRGEMVASAVSVHDDHVNAALHAMIREFGQRYKQAQPPTVGRPNTPAPR
jgi:hypothetical protein